ncbi:fimbria/pilus outer membrane usher protein [Herbaspirillum sp. RTI4]|uniref:fimbria/pilus outer membrane usher protein n=1 Tax=Herbaspirillum sp. RTI4 TaxID=3048640 RepID=UPI002AB37242|nr:fimbria/pilus outer membrane usher protein [Herbaspirillum sp. RTI4]MDY7577732.1 fimbria/pilus outer membrane usher protein [Herbaspirillum sp. RTI4]MEA9980840.1 fimbria/pilus outer membrane usher protein [Herbaspirillum sp. RTI4]
MKPTLLATLISASFVPALPAMASDKSTLFSASRLKSLGLSPDLADFFKEGKRFTAGVNYVTLFVNGRKLGRAQARFDEQGQLCIDADLLTRANIALPDQNTDDNDSNDKQSKNVCGNLKAFYPTAITKLRPGKEEIELIVPPEALRAVSRSLNAADFATGGTAGLFNYDMLFMKNSSPHGTNTTVQGTTEIGLNTNDWALRSRQSYYSFQGRSRFAHLDAYAQTSLPSHKAVFQVGQINAASSMFDTPAMLGAQFFPEGALLQQAGNQVMVNGIAQMEARVEIRQSGVLIHSTIVPPGPFSLTGFLLNNTNIDLDVTVIEGNGAQRRFIVPANSFAVGFTPQEKSFSAALGKPWSYGGDDRYQKKEDLLLVTRTNLPLGNRAGVAIGTLTSQRYHSVGLQLNGAPTRTSSAGVSTLFSYVPRTKEVGTQTTVNTSVQLHDSLSAGASYTFRTNNFRSRSEAIQEQPTITDLRDHPYRPYYQPGNQQLNLNLSYQHAVLGSVGVGYSQFKGNGVAYASRRYSLNWGRNFGRVNASLSLERSPGPDKQTLLYARLNIPIGSGSLSSSVNSTGRRRSGGIDYSDRFNEYASYSVGAQTDSGNRQIGTSASVSALPKYAQAGLSMSRYDGNRTSYSGRISGGLVLHDKGLTLSPYAVRDTFALLSVPGIAGAKIQTSQGPVWTDYRGMAVAPSISPYAESPMDIAIKSLPRNTDVKNGKVTAGLARGAVGNLTFDVLRTRRVLLKILSVQGEPLSKGTSVYSAAGDWISTVSHNGGVMLTGEQLKETLRMTTTDGASCFVSADLPEKPPTDAFYEQLDAVCRPAA